MTCFMAQKLCQVSRTKHVWLHITQCIEVFNEILIFPNASYIVIMPLHIK